MVNFPLITKYLELDGLFFHAFRETLEPKKESNTICFIYLDMLNVDNLYIGKCANPFLTIIYTS